MSDTLMTTAVIVVVLWIIILGSYLILARRQSSIASEIASLEKQIDDGDQT